MQDIKEYKENHAKQNHIKGCSKNFCQIWTFPQIKKGFGSQ